MAGAVSGTVFAGRAEEPLGRVSEVVVAGSGSVGRAEEPQGRVSEVVVAGSGSVGTGEELQGRVLVAGVCSLFVGRAEEHWGWTGPGSVGRV